MSREIDKLIAEHVFGYEPMTDKHWQRACGFNKDNADVKYHHMVAVGCKTRNGISVFDGNRGRLYFAPPLNYSTDIAAAWEVVEKFEFLSIARNHVGSYTVLYKEELTAKDTAPMAICLAALKAKEIEVPND